MRADRSDGVAEVARLSAGAGSAHPGGGAGGVPHPDAELLDDVVGGALRWLGAARGSFRLPGDVATDADPNLTLKPLGELAELAWVIHELHPVAAVREAAADLFGFAWKETRGGELFAELVRGEPMGTYPVELYGVFARAGLRHPGAEELIAATTALRRWRVARDDHTRTLNVLNAERRIGLPPHADFDTVLACTGLGQRPEPWVLDLKAAYGVTHDVFHVTDWGRTPGRLPGHLAQYLRLWLPAWTETWTEERLWDLVGEFLALSACLPGAPYDPVAWRRIAAARTLDGALPESGDPPPPGATPGETFLACYHSTLVAAFAATLARAAPERTAGPVPVAASTEAAPPAGPPGDQRRPARRRPVPGNQAPRNPEPRDSGSRNPEPRESGSRDPEPRDADPRRLSRRDADPRPPGPPHQDPRDPGPPTSDDDPLSESEATP